MVFEGFIFNLIVFLAIAIVLFFFFTRKRFSKVTGFSAKHSPTFLTLVALILVFYAFYDAYRTENYIKENERKILLDKIKQDIVVKKINNSEMTGEQLYNSLPHYLSEELKGKYPKITNEQGISTFCNSLDKNLSSQDLSEIYKILDEDINSFNYDDTVRKNFYDSLITSYSTPISILLGFLAIMFVLKIEVERLNNERLHNRRQAKDNLSDILVYSLKLMENIDRKHVDYMYTYQELLDAGIMIDLSKLIEFDGTRYQTYDTFADYQNLYTINLYTLTEEQQKNFPESFSKFVTKKTCACLEYAFFPKKPLISDKEFREVILFSSRFIKKLLFELENKVTDQQRINFLLPFVSKKSDGQTNVPVETTLFIKHELKNSVHIEWGNQNEDKKNNLKQLYYSTLAKNFDEYAESGTDKHTLNDEVEKISTNIEEILLKKDFDLMDKEHKDIVKNYLSLLDNINKFGNIIESNRRVALSNGNDTSKKISSHGKDTKVQNMFSFTNHLNLDKKQDEATGKNVPFDDSNSPINQRPE